MYLAVPALLTLTFVGVPENMQRVIANVRLPACLPAPRRDKLTWRPQRAYVVYPPEGPRPPTGEELQGQRRKR